MKTIEKQLCNILDSNQGERAVHNFLKKHQYLVTMAFNRAWNFYTCVPEFEFGSEYRSDFLILSAHSVHWHAIFIELKDYNIHLYNKSCLPTKSLRQAEKQIDDWREWKRVNEPYLRQRFSKILEQEDAPAIWPYSVPNFSQGYNSGASEIADMKSYVEFYYHIVIGRSSTLLPEEKKRRLEDKTWGGPEIATYDRLLTMARRVDENNLIIKQMN
jgi:hypothetical protein